MQTTTMTTKGQVTIPKRIRDELGLAPGHAVEFDTNAAGEIVLRNPGLKRARRRDRFSRARGSATVKWRSTAELMALLRPEE